MTSSHISLSALLAQVDKLEGEVKSLSREVDKGEQYVQSLEKMIERDMKEYAEKEKMISDIGKDIRELEDREKFLKNAIDNADQSSRLLSQMESDAKTKLNLEVNRTNDLFHNLSGQVSHYKDKLAKEEEKLRQIPAFENYLSMEERVAEKKMKLAEELTKIAELEKLVSERRGRTDGSGAEARDWSTFVKECVNLAECWLKKRSQVIEADAALISTSNPEDVELPQDSGEDMEAEVDPRDEEDRETLPDIAKVSLQSDQVATSSVRLPTNGAKVNSNLLFPLPSMSMQVDAPKLKPTDDETLMKDLSVESSPPVEPPTPKTKSLHLKLGTSLLALKKSRQQSRGPSPVTSASDMTKPNVKKSQVDLNNGSKVEAMEVDSNKRTKDTDDGDVIDDKAKESSVGKQSSKQRSRPSSPIPRLLNAVFHNSSSSKAPEVSGSKQKSFTLGLPSLSLFPKKKPSRQSEAEDVNKAMTPEENQVKSTQPQPPLLLVPPMPRADASTPLPKDQEVEVSVSQSTPVPSINFVLPSSQTALKLTAPKLSLVPPNSQPLLPTRKADTPRPKVTPKQMPLKSVSSSTSPKMLARNDIQDKSQEVIGLANSLQVRLATPVKRGTTGPRKDVESPVKMVNPFLRKKSTPQKENQRPESSPEVFTTPSASAVNNSFLDCEGESSDFFDDGKAMSASANLFGGSGKSLDREESFFGGEDTQKSKVSSGSGFFSNDTSDGKFGLFFGDEEGEGADAVDDGSFSLVFGGGNDEGDTGNGGFSLF